MSSLPRTATAVSTSVFPPNETKAIAVDFDPTLDVDPKVKLDDLVRFEPAVSIEFTDAAGVRWLRTSDGLLLDFRRTRTRKVVDKHLASEQWNLERGAFISEVVWLFGPSCQSATSPKCGPRSTGLWPHEQSAADRGGPTSRLP